MGGVAEAAARGPSKERRLVGWSVLVGALALLNFSARFTSDDGGSKSDNVLYRYDAAVFGFLFYALILGVVLVLASGFDPREALGFKRPRSWAAAAGIAFGSFVALLVVAAALEPVFGAGKAQGLDPTGWIPEKWPAFALNAIVVALFGPIVEELLFRGIGFFLLLGFGEWVAIVVTAVAFSLTHGIAQGLPIFFIIGVGLALLRSRTASIYPSMMLHICFNGFGVIAGLFN
jgi:membrane protease YdiL (CAAX protease family)